MTRKQIMISVPEWIEKDIIGITDNKSARVQELIMKGHLYEKDQANIILAQMFKKGETSQEVTMRDTFNPVRYASNFFDRISEFAI